MDEDYSFPRELVTYISEFDRHGREMRGINTIFRDVQEEVDEGRVRRLTDIYGVHPYNAVVAGEWGDVLFMLTNMGRFPSLADRVTDIATASMTAHRYGVFSKTMALGPNLYRMPEMKGMVLDVAADTYVGEDMNILTDNMVREGRYDLFSHLLDRDVHISDAHLTRMAIAAARVPIPNLVVRIMGVIPDRDYYSLFKSILLDIPSYCNDSTVSTDEKERCHSHISMAITVARRMDPDVVGVLASSHHVLPMVYWSLRAGSRAYHRITVASPLRYRDKVENLIDNFA